MNYQGMFDWLINIPKMLEPFYDFLLWESPLLKMNMLTILTFGGFLTIIVFHIIHLVNVVSG